MKVSRFVLDNRFFLFRLVLSTEVLEDKSAGNKRPAFTERTKHLTAGPG